MTYAFSRALITAFYHMQSSYPSRALSSLRRESLSPISAPSTNGYHFIMLKGTYVSGEPPLCSTLEKALPLKAFPIELNSTLHRVALKGNLTMLEALLQARSRAQLSSNSPRFNNYALWVKSSEEADEILADSPFLHSKDFLDASRNSLEMSNILFMHTIREWRVNEVSQESALTIKEWELAALAMGSNR